MSVSSLPLMRRLALALPETVESSHMHTPDFRVGGKIFATARHESIVAMLKLPLHIQEAMITERPDVFSLPGGWGKHGATLVQTDKVDPDLLKDLLNLAWRQVAPKTLVARHADRSETPE